LWTDEKLTSETTEFGIRDTFTRTVPQGTFMTVSHYLFPNMNKVGYHLNEDHPAAFAATHEGYEALRWRVPVDDTNTMHFTLYFAPFVNGTVSAKVPKTSRRRDWATARRANTGGTMRPAGLRAAIKTAARRRVRDRSSTVAASI
jgi:hypothetical protein